MHPLSLLLPMGHITKYSFREDGNKKLEVDEGLSGAEILTHEGVFGQLVLEGCCL